jgi:hypothetical protein
MVAQSKRLTFGMIVILLAISACSNPSAPTAPTALPMTQPVEPTTAATETATAVTQATPSSPFASVTTVTDCRGGPGDVYDVVTNVEPGMQLVIVGKYTLQDASYWIVQPPTFPKCWLWDQSVTVAGNVADLPQIPAPATPIPSAAVGIILVTVVGPKTDGNNNALISGATVELGVADANGDFVPTGEQAEELPEPERGHYRFLNVSAGPKLVQASIPPDYRLGMSAVNVVSGGEPSQVEVRVGWSYYDLVNCSNLPTQIQRFSCYNQLIAATPGGGVYDPDLAPSPTP